MRRRFWKKVKTKMKIFTGQVVSTKMQKTATVAVDRVIVHPIYKKRFKQTKKYQTHNELGAGVGQKVKFVASKLYSKTKRWKIIEILGYKSNKLEDSKKQARQNVTRKAAKKG